MYREIKPVILCGGSGTRLWPLSRASFPKQFVPLINGQSLLDLTVERVKGLGSPIYIGNEEHRFLIQESIIKFSMTSGISSSHILLEPSGRNTAAAIASAALLQDIMPADLLLFLPSDHFIPDAEGFIEMIHSGVPAAEAGYIITFGVQPSFPSPAYGYIKLGFPIVDFDKSHTTTYSVKSFIEKPCVDDAVKMLLTGNCLWNAGIFLCKASVLIEELSKHAPDILDLCQEAMSAAKIDGNFIRPKKETFLACRSESFDFAVMEHVDKAAVIPFKGSWNDVGSWNALPELSPKDEFGNCISGQGFAVESINTYINAPHRPVVALGTSDLVIVDTLDALLVASIHKVEQVKDVVEKLKGIGISQAITHRRVARPWGWYDSIDGGDFFQVKRILVKPGASLSLQMHHHRAEHWIVVKGTAKVTNGELVFLLQENQSTYIPIGSKHRLENPEKTDLEMIEVQSGSYLGEDDIVRIEDTYGRT